MYKFNFDYFKEWSNEHRNHQRKAINIITKNNEGQIIVPTGAGKTRIQIHAHVEDMIQKTLNDNVGIYVIAAHRLILCQQLLDEFVDLAIKCGLDFNLLFIGSLNYDIDYKFQEYSYLGFTGNCAKCNSTTNKEKIQEVYNKTKEAERHLIVVSTYHSFSKLKYLPEIDICTYDEAHTTTANDFTKNILETMEVEKDTEENMKDGEVEKNVIETKQRIKRNYFFTATRKANKEDDGLGMNNVEIYGNILLSISPREMIDAGEIVEPQLHFIDTKEHDETFTNNKMLVNTVIESFEIHRDKIKSVSYNPDKIEPKLLICCNGTEESFNLHDNEEFRKFCINNNIQVFLLNSAKGYYHNFIENRRNSILYKIRNLKDNEKAILIHIKILTEGIDLPSITGVMPLRNLPPICLFQTIGRAARLIREDRQKIYNNIISVNDKEKMIKPYCYILLPIYYKYLSDSNIMVDLIKHICNTYEIPYENFIKDDICITTIDEIPDRITDKDKSNPKQNVSELHHNIESIIKGINIESMIQSIKDDSEEFQKWLDS